MALKVRYWESSTSRESHVSIETDSHYISIVPSPQVIKDEYDTTYTPIQFVTLDHDSNRFGECQSFSLELDNTKCIDEEYIMLKSKSKDLKWGSAGFNDATLSLLLLKLAGITRKLNRSNLTLSDKILSAMFDFGESRNLSAYKNFSSRCSELVPQDVWLICNSTSRFADRVERLAAIPILLGVVFFVYYFKN
eukprot:TRINITY_DN6974_c0_g1_i1.p1 TRINITY_DN6974_c0_g1~~TRINITY_DN6974_c0_g1_i1.p1  ORF type:complete len:193 (+),score=4.03 TRINITY_DN6974_c0_g1_i1:50-628(+)